MAGVAIQLTVNCRGVIAAGMAARWRRAPSLPLLPKSGLDAQVYRPVKEEFGEIGSNAQESLGPIGPSYGKGPTEFTTGRSPSSSMLRMCFECEQCIGARCSWTFRGLGSMWVG